MTAISETRRRNCTPLARGRLSNLLHETEIGTLPADWRIVSLGEYFDFQNGYNAEGGRYGSGMSFVNVLEIILNSHLTASHIPGKVQMQSKQIRVYKVEWGDILFNRTSETQDELGLTSVYIDSEEVIFGGFVIRGKPKGHAFDTLYIGYAARADFVRAQIISRGQGAVRANIGQSDLKTVKIPLPLPKEQHAIAEVLSDADALIEGLERLIAKKLLIKEGAMQELLSGTYRLPGFNGEWEKKKFGELFDFLSTATNSRADQDENADTIYIHYGDIHTRFHYHLDLGSAPAPRIARLKAKNASLIKNGDLIMADASEDLEGVGKAVEVQGLEDGMQAISGLHTYLLREKADFFVPGFKGHLANSNVVRSQYARVLTGMKVFGVSKRALRDLVLPVPEPEEQRGIVAVLSDMNEELEELDAKLAKVRQIKQGMMQELLTGRIRLV